MTNYENYLSKIWDDEPHIENLIDWALIKIIKNEMINTSLQLNTFNLRVLTESEFNEQMQTNKQFALKWQN